MNYRNPKLLKLAEQAGYLSDYAYTDEQLTQFAESIVKECYENWLVEFYSFNI